MNWKTLCEDLRFEDFPYKIETNEYDQIVMSLVKYYHSKYAGRIASELTQLGAYQHGMILIECAVNTRRGTKHQEHLDTNERET